MNEFWATNEQQTKIYSVNVMFLQMKRSKAVLVGFALIYIFVGLR
jgi:hypothetical protein